MLTDLGSLRMIFGFVESEGRRSCRLSQRESCHGRAVSARHLGLSCWGRQLPRYGEGDGRECGLNDS